MSVNLGINIQRSPNRINQALRAAGVNGQYPKLLADFESEYYLANGGSKTFANAITHSRLGQATMVDGYGPELVTNGSFTNDISGWTADDATISWDSGRLKTTVTGSTTGSAYQAISVEAGKAYVITGFIKVLSSSETSNITLRTGTDAGTGFLYQAGLQAGIGTEQVNGVYESDQTRTIYIHLRTFEGDNTTTLFDNVSVREMPVIKWAPHNLVSYSEDLSDSSWSGINGTLTVDSFTASTTNSAHYFFQDIATITATDHVVSFEVKAYGDAQYFQIALGINDVSGNPFVNFDLLSGTITADTNSIGAIVDVNDGWYRCEVSVVSAVSNNFAVVGVAIGSSSSSRLQAVDASALNLNYGIRRAHLYRSDLGGMVNNPDRGDSYVPTTSSAVYLPRRGHHVYNGYEWVNEGLLHESEARTNLVDYSQNFSVWSNNTGIVKSLSSSLSPDGSANAYDITDNGDGDNFILRSFSIPTTNTSYVCSVFIKKTTNDAHYLNLAVYISGGTAQYLHATFDSNNGVFTAGSGISLASDTFVEDFGSYWRIAHKTTNTGSNTTFQIRVYPAYNNNGGTGRDNDVTGTKVLYGAQLEAASTPSSYIPTTSGASVTRAAESLTIPSANLPWPTPQYIGGELVTNGTFDTSSNWVLPTGFSIGSGVMSYDGSGSAFSYTVQPIVTTVSKVYAIDFDTTAISGSLAFGVYKDTTILKAISSTGHTTVFFVATSTTTNIIFKVQGDATKTFSIDNVSVREINPLSVSIQMRGLMNYADEDTGPLPDGSSGQNVFVSWKTDASNYVSLASSTFSGFTGSIYTLQESAGTFDFVRSGDTTYSPDINVPYNIASRHGSTFINGAVDGVALTANTTPVALPDLSSTDLELGYDYMGTISEFRIWDKDIGDEGLEAATAPSLEPSLSLTFDSTNSSYVDTGWSE